MSPQEGWTLDGADAASSAGGWEVRDLRLWEGLTIAMLAVAGFAHVLRVAAALISYAHLLELTADRRWLQLESERTMLLDAAVRICTGGVVVCTLLAGVPFLVWLAGSVANVHARGIRFPRISLSWAIGCWFIPFTNLTLPCVVVQDLHRASAAARAGSHDHWKSPPPLVPSWWLAWIVSALSGICSGFWRVSWHDDDERKWVALIAAGSSVAGVVAAILAIRVVRAISKLQREWPPPPPRRRPTRAEPA